MDQATRDAVRDGCKRSAAAVLPVVFETTELPASLIDVGAGEGHWRDAALALGVRNAYGVDVEFSRLIDKWDAEARDELPWFDVTEKWNLALCLEVAEHLTPDAGEWLVSELCRVAEAVVWSAAIPGQGGDGHVNEQWPVYWDAVFYEYDWMLIDPWRMTLWENPDVEPWYRQNLLLALPYDMRLSGFDTPGALVDPVTWSHHRGVPAPGA